MKQKWNGNKEVFVLVATKNDQIQQIIKNDASFPTREKFCPGRE
jgi:hypothetical protein